MERIVVRAPTDGLDYRLDPTNLSPRAAASLQNLRIIGGDVLAKRSGHSLVGVDTKLAGAVMHIDQFFTLSGSWWPVVITTTHVYYYDYTTRTWVDITPATRLKGTLADAVTADIVLDTFIFTNGVDPIMKWTGTGLVEPLAGAPAARIVRKFAERLFALHIINNPQTLKWTAPGSITDWSGPGSGAVSLYEGADWIVTAELLGPYLVIYKERSIVTCQYVGGATLFRFDVVQAGVGLLAPRAVINMGNEHIFLGSDNIYAYGGGRSIEAIGDPIQTELFGTINPSAMARSISVINEDLNEIWFVVPTGTSEVPNTAWVYNYLYKKWTKHALSVTALGYWNVEDMRTLGSFGVTTIGEVQTRLGDRVFLTAAPLIVAGTSGGLVMSYDANSYNDLTTPIDAFFITKQFDGTDAQGSSRLPPDISRRYKRWLRVEFVARGQQIDLTYRCDEGDWTGLKSIPLSSNWAKYSVDLDASARTLQLKFANAVARSGFELKEFSLFFIPGSAV